MSEWWAAAGLNARPIDVGRRTRVGCGLGTALRLKKCIGHTWTAFLSRQPCSAPGAIPHFSRSPILTQHIANGLQRLLVTTLTTETRPPPRRFQDP
jgi:hypothetical protein